MDQSWVTHELAARGDAEALIEREWLLSNGTGAYAMGTAAGANTRRYHGLLVAATHPPVGRIIALNNMLEQLTVDDERYEFASGVFQGDAGSRVFAPAGHDMLQSFRKGLGIRWTYSHGSVEFVRELHLHWKAQAATLRYLVRGLGGGKATLRLSPMLTLRDFHSLLKKDEVDGQFHVEPAEAAVTVRRGDAAVTLACETARFKAGENWWFNVHYPLDAERGQGHLEDCFVPGCFELPVVDEQQVIVTVALDDESIDAEAWHDDGRAEHLSPLLEHIDEPDDNSQAHQLKRMLIIAADDFVVDRFRDDASYSTILAGFPWFADWGRDTFIALPGLLLTTGRFDEARATLRVFAEAIVDGLVPNRFDDYNAEAAHYNTVDASLWFVNAAIAYLHATGDRDAWDDWLAEAVGSIVDAYIKGTQYDIRMAGDGLITAGSAQTQLTWMDAATPDADGRLVIFTPRFGKAVEINALWFNALAGLEAIFSRSKDPQRKSTAAHYKKLCSRVKRSFAKVFWDDDLSCLVDHVWYEGEGLDAEAHVDKSIRPNQIFAASLPHSPLPRTKQAQVLDMVREKLLTPVGLRTLPPDDPNYHPHYTGAQFDRDKAYHQGTIWPWLIGPYAEAVLRVGRFSDEARTEARAALEPLLEQLAGRGLGQLHEIHEATPPHRPVGCIAQAWSVAEVLRVMRLIEQE